MSVDGPNLGWGHVNINVRDLDRSIEFYKLLGFEMFVPGIPYLGLTAEGEPKALPEPVARALGLPAGQRGRACIMQLNEGLPKLDLTEFTAEDQNGPLGNRDLGLVRLCLASHDLRKDYEQLHARGVAFVSEPRPGHDGMAHVATCIDPDGTLIELIQVHLERWPR